MSMHDVYVALRARYLKEPSIPSKSHSHFDQPLRTPYETVTTAVSSHEQVLCYQRAALNMPVFVAKLKKSDIARIQGVL